METNKVAAAVVMTLLGASLAGCGGSAASAPRSAGSPEAPTVTGGSAPEPGGDAAPATAAPSPEREARASSEPADRPGLGTEWGETRFSRISTVPFVRADADTPLATASLFYNDAAGARAMASQSGFRRTSSGSFTIAGGAVSIGLRDESGNFLSGFVAGERDYAIGEAGSRYAIVLKNRTDTRFECVVSVDGLDVLDGKAASFRKRGYLLEPGAELEIDGFRQSTESVAAFRFGSVRNSYAGQKHGDTRNVGLIGVALFHERGSNPRVRDEVRRRHDANPFPGQFATPPN
jgi:hypothetical protein